jgi:hypothetical protein
MNETTKKINCIENVGIKPVIPPSVSEYQTKINEMMLKDVNMKYSNL